MILRELLHLIGFEIDKKSWKKAMNSFDSLINKARETGKKLLIGLTAPLAFISSRIVKTIGEFEQINIAFETMLGSVAKAKKFVGEMVALAAKTPFEIKGIFKSARQLLAVGIEADKVGGDLITLGNIASGLSVPLGQLVKAFGDVKAKTKLTGEELRQFTGAGVPLLEALAKKLGKTKAVITAMISKGQIGFDLVRGALKDMSGKGGKFFNLMIRQSKTLFGLWSNLQDFITITFLKFESSWLPILKKIVTFGMKMVELISKKLTPNIVRFITILGLVSAALGPILLAVGVLSLPMLKLIAIVGAVSAAVALLIDDFIVFSKGGKSFMGRFLPPWEELKPRLQKIWKSVLAVLVTVMGFIKKIIEGIAVFIQAFMDEDLDKMGEGIKKFLNGLWGIVKLIIIKGNIWILKQAAILFIKFISLLMKFFAKIKRIIGKIFDRFKSLAKVQEFLSIGKDIITGGNRSFTDLFTSDKTPSKKEVTVNATINATVPEGTEEQQKGTIKQYAKDSFQEVFNALAGELAIEFPEKK